jgi:hypothetical protein
MPIRERCGRTVCQVCDGIVPIPAIARLPVIMLQSLPCERILDPGVRSRGLSNRAERGGSVVPSVVLLTTYNGGGRSKLKDLSAYLRIVHWRDENCSLFGPHHLSAVAHQRQASARALRGSRLRMSARSRDSRSLGAVYLLFGRASQSKVAASSGPSLGDGGRSATAPSGAALARRQLTARQGRGRWVRLVCSDPQMTPKNS